MPFLSTINDIQSSNISYSWLEDSNTGLSYVSNKSLALTTDGVNRLIVDPTGNVGINTGSSNIDYNLHVKGSLFVDEYCNMPYDKLVDGVLFHGNVGVTGNIYTFGQIDVPPWSQDYLSNIKDQFQEMLFFSSNAAGYSSNYLETLGLTGATLTNAGLVQLNSNYNDTSITTAATPSAVKYVYDRSTTLFAYNINTSNLALTTSNVAYITRVFALNTSNMAMTTSNIAYQTSNIAYLTSNDAYKSINAAISASNIAVNASNVAYLTHTFAASTSNMAMATSNVAYLTETLAIDASNVAYLTKTFAANTSNVAIATSNIAYLTNSFAANTSNLAIDASNTAYLTKTFAASTSNLAITTSNIAYVTNTFAANTSNLALYASNNMVVKNSAASLFSLTTTSSIQADWGLITRRGNDGLPGVRFQDFNGNYIHGIKTRHSTTDSTSNAFDFYLWQSSQQSNINGNKHIMSVTSPGVGIYTSNPQYPLEVKGDSYFNGLITTTVDVNIGSDSNIKQDFSIIDDALNKVNQLTGYTFSYRNIDSTKRYTGLIAQQVQAILPEAVNQTPQGQLTLGYGSLAGLFVEAIKDITSRLDAIEQKLNF